MAGDLQASTKRRRWPFVIAAFLLLLVLLSGTAVLLRTAIAEQIAIALLERRGVAAPALRVAELGVSRIRIEELALGTAKELTAAQIQADYDLGGLIAGDGPEAIAQVTIAGVTARIDLTGETPMLGSLQPLIEAGEADERTGPSDVLLPKILLSELRVEAETPLGAMTATASGEAGSSGPGAVTLDLATTVEGALGRLSGRTSLVRAADGALDGRILIEQGALSLPAEQTGAAAEIGGLIGTIVVSMPPNGFPALAAELSLTDIGLEAGRFRSASLDLDVTESDVAADVQVNAEDDLLALALKATVKDYLEAPTASLALTFEGSSEAALFDRIALPLRQGRGRVELQAAGTLAPFAAFLKADQSNENAATAETAIDWLSAARLDGRLALRFAEIAYPGRFQGLAGRLALDASLHDRGLSLTLAADADLQNRQADPTWLTDLGLPPQALDWLSSGVRFRLPLREGRPVRITLQPGDEGLGLTFDGLAQLWTGLGNDQGGPAAALEARGELTLDETLALKTLTVPSLALRARDIAAEGQSLGELTYRGALSGAPNALEARGELRVTGGSLSYETVRARGVVLHVPATAGYLNGALELSLDKPARIEAKGISQRGGPALTEPIALTLTEGTVIWSPPSAEGTGGGRLAHDIALAPTRVALSAPQAEGPPVRVEAALGAARLRGEQEFGATYRGRAEMADSTIDLPDKLLRLEGLNLRARFEGPPGLPVTTSFKVARVVDRTLPARLPIVAVSGSLRRSGQRLQIEGEGRFPEVAALGDGTAIVFTGDYDVKRGAGRLQVQPLRLGFSPGALQPRDLIPALAELREVAGQADLTGALDWSKDSFQGEAKLGLRDLSFKRQEVSVEGLDLTLVLDRIQPLSSPPGQRLSVRRVETVLPIETIDASFHVLPGAPAKAMIERLSFAMAGGSFAVEDVLIDPGGDNFEAELAVLGLELEELFQALEIEGLSGSGKLSGSLPVAMTGETVVIRDGRLTSDAPGILRYRSAQVTASLPPDADALELFNNPVDLTLRAMENFHYDSLTIEIAKDAAGDSSLKLRLAGKNPELLDGYPFNLNINLAGNVEPVLAALRQGLSLSEELLGQSWKLR